MSDTPIVKHTDVIAALVPPIQGEIPFEGLDYSIPEVETSGLDIALLQSAFLQYRKPIFLYNMSVRYNITTQNSTIILYVSCAYAPCRGATYKSVGFNPGNNGHTIRDKTYFALYGRDSNRIV